MAAALEVVPALLRLDYESGDTILEQPAARNQKPPREPYPVDLSFVRPGDLLVQTTRPPLDDHIAESRKYIGPTYSELEALLFKVWRRFFKNCERSNVELEPEVRSQMTEGFENRRLMEFYEGYGAPYKQLNACDRRGWKKPVAKGHTAAFLLRLDEAWPQGPGLVGAFGMDGVSTLVWCYRLARDFDHLLEKPGFVVVDLGLGEMPERLTNLRWAMDLPIEVVLHWQP